MNLMIGRQHVIASDLPVLREEGIIQDAETRPPQCSGGVHGCERPGRAGLLRDSICAGASSS